MQSAQLSEINKPLSSVIFLAYDMSVNATLNQYAFWVVDFDSKSNIDSIEESAVYYLLDTSLQKIEVHVGEQAFKLTDIDASLLEAIELNGSILIVSVPSDESKVLAAYTLQAK